MINICCAMPLQVPGAWSLSDGDSGVPSTALRGPNTKIHTASGKAALHSATEFLWRPAAWAIRLPGVFWASGDSGTVYSSIDGSAWKVGGQFPAEAEVVGTLSVRLKASVELSQDSGSTWKAVMRAGNLAGVAAGFPGN